MKPLVVLGLVIVAVAALVIALLTVLGDDPSVSGGFAPPGQARVERGQHGGFGSLPIPHAGLGVIRGDRCLVVSSPEAAG